LTGLWKLGGTSGISLIPLVGMMATVAFTLRTDEELEAALNELAEVLRISKQEVIRRSVLELRDREAGDQALSDSSQRMRERWGSVLDRLGSV
jgi:predicted transcriptional regulator